MADKKLSFKEKSSIKFVEQTEPKFLRDMKEKMGFRPPPTISDKFQDGQDAEEQNNDDDLDDIRKMSEEDRPQIVVLNEGTDIDEKDLNKEIEELRKSEDRKKIDDRQIVFRKPVKHQNPSTEENDECSKNKKIKNVDKDKSQPAANNSRLLSFHNDDEDDE